MVLGARQTVWGGSCDDERTRVIYFQGREASNRMSRAGAS